MLGNPHLIREIRQKIYRAPTLVLSNEATTQVIQLPMPRPHKSRIPNLHQLLGIKVIAPKFDTRQISHWVLLWMGARTKPMF